MSTEDETKTKAATNGRKWPLGDYPPGEVPMGLGANTADLEAMTKERAGD